MTTSVEVNPENTDALPKPDEAIDIAPEGSVSSSSDDDQPPCCCQMCCIRCSDKWKEVRDEIVEPFEELGAYGKKWMKKSCTLGGLKSKLPITKWILKYRWKHFQGDLVAGITVGLTVIPQGLAYAQVAKLPPQYGLYSAFMGCFVYLFLGTSKDITIGPTAIMSLLTAQFGVDEIALDPTYAIILCLFSGFVQLGMAILHLGFIVDFISHPVINSFTTAAAITIAWGQISKWFGLKNIPQDFMSQVREDLQQIPQSRLWDFLMGSTCVILLFLMKKMKEINWGKTKEMSKVKRVIRYIVWLMGTARNAIIVLFASVAAAIFLQHNLKPFSLTGNIRPGLPPFRVPDLTLKVGNHTHGTIDILSNIGAGLAIVPILGLVEIIAIGKTFARRNGYTIDADQELLATGISNIVSCFVGSYPVTGSFSRTAVNAQSGVMTPAGGIWTAALVLLALAFLTPLFYYIPNSALAAVIIMAVLDMIDFSLLWKLWKIKKIELLPWIATFVCSLCIGIEVGILVGIGISNLIILYIWARPKLRLSDVQVSSQEAVVVNVDQGLVFPGMEHFKDKVYSTALSSGIFKSVVLDFSSVANADFSAVSGLHQLIEDFSKKNKKLVVCNIRPNVLRVFNKAKLKNFHHASSVNEAIAMIEEERIDLPVLTETASVPIEISETERRSIRSVANDDDDEEEQEQEQDRKLDDVSDRNYIATDF